MRRVQGNATCEHGGANLSQVLYDLVNRRSIREHAKQLLKFPPFPARDAVASRVLHEFSVKPEVGKSLLLRAVLKEFVVEMRRSKDECVKTLLQSAEKHKCYEPSVHAHLI
jgi:hypothetical protein